MLGKMSKYSFILFILSVLFNFIFFEPQDKEAGKVFLVSFFFLFVSVLSFLGYILNQPFVVRIDDSDRK